MPPTSWPNGLMRAKSAVEEAGYIHKIKPAKRTPKKPTMPCSAIVPVTSSIPCFSASRSRHHRPTAANAAAIRKAINFERVRGQTALKLFLCAADVQTAKVKIFPGKELRVEHVLASTCLPLLMQSVEVDGEYIGTVVMRAIPRSI